MASEYLEAGIDFENANAARMYDYYLGGAHNFAVDRARADHVIAALPDTVFIARSQRAFLGRVVRWCLHHGIDQFLDLGSGIPGTGNVHEVAHEIDGGARVAYVDFEPVAVAHAGEILERLATTTVTVSRADVRDPASVLAQPGVAGLLDFRRPVAVLAISVLPFVEGDVAALMRSYYAVLAPGSAVAITHGSDDQPDPAVETAMIAVRQAYASSATPVVWRDRAELHQVFAGLDLVEPGLVDMNDWPEASAERRASWVYGGLALVP